MVITVLWECTLAGGYSYLYWYLWLSYCFTGHAEEDKPSPGQYDSVRLNLMALTSWQQPVYNLEGTLHLGV